MIRRHLPLLLLALSACAPQEDGPRAVSAPLSDKADTVDSADRSCGVILRSFKRKLDASGQPATRKGWFVWVATVDVATSISGAKGEVMYRADGASTWTAFSGTAISDGETGDAKFQRYAIEVDVGTTPTPAMDLRSWEYQHAQLAAYAITASGERIFDHNRVASDFSNYDLTPTNSFQIDAAPGICPLEQPRAELVFKPNAAPEQHGPFVAGGKLTIDYALDRLPSCRLSQAGYQLWDIEANVKFNPQGTLVTRSVTRVSTPPGQGPTREAVPLELDIPLGTQRVEIWFRNFSAMNSCETWDSDDGRNHHFEGTTLPAPVGWAGDWGNGMSRSCEHRDGLAEPIVIDEYIRERACTFVDADVYAPGTTDIDGGRTEHLWAQVEYAYDGGALQYDFLQAQGRVGNNQRYRWNLPYEVRMAQRSFTQLSFAFRFSTDGVHFHRIASGAGPDGGAARTLIETAQ